MDIAFRLLSYRDRSVFEVRSALVKKDFDAETIDAVIKALSEKGYLNDQKFAREYGRLVSKRRRVGPNYIVNKLIKKGIERELALEAVAEIFNNSEEVHKQINRWISKKQAACKKEMAPTRKKKRIYDFLLRKGFTHESVFKALDKWSF